MPLIVKTPIMMIKINPFFFYLLLPFLDKLLDRIDETFDKFAKYVAIVN